MKKYTFEILIVVTIALMIAGAVYDHIHRLPPYTVVCDGHGKFAFITDYGEVFPMNSSPSKFDSYDAAQASAARIKEIEEAPTPPPAPVDKTEWHECK